jgi:hypothetical protein
MTLDLSVFYRKYTSVSLKMIPTQSLAPLARVPEIHFLACDQLCLVEEIRDVRVLSLDDCSRIHDLSCLRCIHTLSLSECGWLCGLQFLTSLSSTLRALDISLTKVTNLSPISQCDLEWIDIGGLEVKDVSALVGIPHVSMHSCGWVTDVSPLQYAKELDLGYCTGAKYLEPLKNIGKIQLRRFNGWIPYSLLSPPFPTSNIHPTNRKTVQCCIQVEGFFGIIGKELTARS